MDPTSGERCAALYCLQTQFVWVHWMLDDMTPGSSLLFVLPLSCFEPVLQTDKPPLQEDCHHTRFRPVDSVALAALVYRSRM
jgi:hypothetical protein